MGTRRGTLLLFFAVTLLCVGCDHASKRVAEELLGGAAPISLASDAVRFELVSNAGAFLGLGAQLSPFVRKLLLVAAVPLLLAWICASLLRAHGRSLALCVGLGLLAGGGLGNWLDRVLYEGRVTDFVSVGLGPLRTGVFNLADVAVMAGVALLLASTWRASRTDEP